MTLFQLLSLIDQNINTKTGNDRITGAQDNMVRKQMIQALIDICSSGFGGDIAPAQNPGTQIKPIYYFATQAAVYPFCGNIEVLTLPSFIVWNGSAWSVKEFEIIANIIAPESQAKGIVTQATVKPSVFAVNDWYLFVGPGTLNWPGSVKDAPGVVYCTSTNPEAWAIQKFSAGVSDTHIKDDIRSCATTIHPRWNSSSFNGLDFFNLGIIPSGIRSDGGNLYSQLSTFSRIWTSTQGGVSTEGINITTETHAGYAIISASDKNFGFSILLLRAYTAADGEKIDGKVLPGAYTDKNGNKYDAVMVGDYVIMNQPLRTTKYGNGTNIVTGLSDIDWSNTSAGAYAIYPHAGVFATAAEMVEAYGLLYNWFTCAGLEDGAWHVPTNTEMTNIRNHAISYPEITSGNVGNYLKSWRQVNSPLTRKFGIKPIGKFRMDADYIFNLPEVSGGAGLTPEQVQELADATEHIDGVDEKKHGSEQITNAAALANIETAANAKTSTILGNINARLFEQIGFNVVGQGVDAIAGKTAALTSIPYAFKAYELRVDYEVAPTGSSAIVTFYKNGTSIGTVTILANEFAGVTSLSSSVSFAEGDSLRATVTQEGLTIKGQSVNAYIQGIKYQ